MNKSKVFILLGTVLLIIGLYMFFYTTDRAYLWNKYHESLTVTEAFIRQLFIIFFIGQTGAFLLILGIRDYKKDIKIYKVTKNND